MRLLFGLILASCAYAQFFPFPGPGRIAASGGGGGTPTITYVQGCVGNASGASATCAMPGNVTAGNLLVVTSKTDGVSVTAFTATSSAGVTCTWTSAGVAQHTVSNFAGGMAYCVVPSTGAQTVQVTATGGSGSFTDIAVAEYSSSSGWAASPLDVFTSSVNTASSTSCPSGTTSATTNANDLVFGACMTWNAGQTWGAVSGFTNRAASSRNTTGAYDKTVTSTGTQSFTGVLSASDISIGFVAAFKAN